MLGVPIHNYIVVKLSSFRNIVDALGGVEVDVKERMKYIDPSIGGVKIDIPPGKQHLDGKKAEEFVRYRGYADADIGRVKAQQEFMKALINKALRPATILKLPKIIDIVQQNVETDIQPLEYASLANFVRQIKQEDIKMHGFQTQIYFNTSYLFSNQLDDTI